MSLQPSDLTDRNKLGRIKKNKETENITRYDLVTSNEWVFRSIFLTIRLNTFETEDLNKMKKVEN